MTTNKSNIKSYNNIGKNQKILLELLVFNMALYTDTLSLKDIRILDSLLKYDLITDLPNGESGQIVYVYDDLDSRYVWDLNSPDAEAIPDNVVNIADQIDSNTRDFIDLHDSQQSQIDTLVAELMEAQADIRYLEKRLAKRDKQIRKARKALKG